MKEFGVIDMHCDTITKLVYEKKDIRENDGHISLNKMQKGNYMMQCFAIFLYLKAYPHPFASCDSYIDDFYRFMQENSDIIKPVTTADEIEENWEKGLMSGMLTIEEGGALEGNLANLQHFYDRGVRMMTLTWNFENELAYPNYMDKSGMRPDTERGLKPLGIECVKKMQQLGMIVDVSHLNDAGIYDVFRLATRPIVASHSNARAVCNVPRNLTDDMLRKLKENGGITGINYCPDFISEKTDENQIPMIVRHINHIVSVAGVETVGLGSDFDGIPTPNGMSDCTRTHLLYEALKQEGYSQQDIDLMFHGNFLRVLRANQVRS
ncbi:MAG: dipeptidase [Erysipelotrichaceae bacterium]|nr:dipeptidase [Erysipelotrichaceae bacterium]MBQ4251626.1 dipeptidase [Erysipelotrichaceae bacterium]